MAVAQARSAAALAAALGLAAYYYFESRRTAREAEQREQAIRAELDAKGQAERELQERMHQMQEELNQMQERQQAAARLKREQRERARQNQKAADCTQSKQDAPAVQAGAWTQLRYTTGLPIPLHAVGVVRSCYEDVQGTPRQPGLVPLARASVVLCSGVSPDMIDGLALHSHAWVIFLFHANTNGAKTLASRNSRGETFPAKIRPPRGHGRGHGGSKVKVGVLSTRTPHRPNPVGLSLVRIEAVDAKKRTVRILGADVIDGSPVLDIKPYLPPYDAPLPGVEVYTPLERWYGADVSPLRDVIVAEQQRDELHAAAEEGALRLYAGQPDLALDALRQTLAADVSRTARDAPYHLRFDGLIVEYTVADDKDATSPSKVPGTTTLRRVEAAAPDSRQTSATRAADHCALTVAIEAAFA